MLMKVPFLVLSSLSLLVSAASIHHARGHHELASRMTTARDADLKPLRRRSGRCSAKPSVASSSSSSSISSDAATSTSSSATTTSSTTSEYTSTSTSTTSYQAPTTTIYEMTASYTSSYSSSAAAATTTTSSGSSSSLTPNGIKAGIAGGDSYNWMQDHIGWWYDWTPNPSKSGKPIGVSMLWGAGSSSDSNDAKRLATFKALTSTPQYVLGFEEPDCAAGGGSAGVDVSTAAAVWDSLIAPMGEKGALLGSPSMCKQAAETWLTPFKNAISRQWDFTAIHVNKNNMDGVKTDIDHYWNTYGKPIWVTEFACVDDSNGFVPCTDQDEINTFIADIVDLFESDNRVYAYAYSDGEGLGSVWPTVSNGQLSQSGQAYLNAISKYH